MIEVTPTGIAELDLFLRGGLPRGFTTLVLAPAGSGAEIFAKQFACAPGAGAASYISTDETRAEVEATAQVAGWPMDHLTVVDLQSEFADAMVESQRRSLEADARRVDPRELVERTHSRDLLHRPPVRRHDDLLRLLEPFARSEPPARVVVHSLDFFLNLHPPEEVVGVLTAQKAANAKAGGQLMWVLAKGAHAGLLERRLELLSDCLIELEVTRKGTLFERYFMVKKVKNRSYGIGVSTYDVTPRGFNLETLERIV